MNQAIVTKETPKGFVTAKCRSGRAMYKDTSTHRLVRHCRAARFCAEKFGWTGYFRGASSPDSKGFCFVWVSHEAPDNESAISFFIGTKP